MINEKEKFFNNKELIMAHFVTDACIGCMTCIDECPHGCISEVEMKALIDADCCVDCGACLEVCPSNAIIAE